jgi:hypothetical protein
MSAASRTTDATCRWQISPQMRTLREALEQWAVQGEWQSVWELDIDIPLDLNARFCGPIESAVEEVLGGFATHSTPIRATFYRGNRVLRLWAANQ